LTHFILSGAITGAITTPLDVLKTRLMVQVDILMRSSKIFSLHHCLFKHSDVYFNSQGQANQYRGIISCAQTILREEGAGAFLKGIEPRVLWIGIGGSIFFGVLEKTKSILAERNSRKVRIL
jgi:solute carrier family 25 S-adenosylmethionine transporter 26